MGFEITFPEPMNARAQALAPRLPEEARSSLPKGPLWAKIADLVRLTKPRVTSLVLVTGLGGLFAAVQVGHAEPFGWMRAVASVLGITLVVSGANALNMYIERDIDGRMERTARRPLPARRLEPRLALAFGLFIGLGSLPLLALAANALTAWLAAFALFSYVLVYTPLKQITPWAVVIGAVPGAMPPLLGWTAASGALDPLGLALFAVLFFWQLPHFLAIATFRREQYTRAGFKVMPETHGPRSTRIQSTVYSTAVLGASLTIVPCLPGPMGFGHWFYAIIASIVGGMFVALSAMRPTKTKDGELANEGQREIAWARRLFFASLLYLPVLVTAIMVGVV